MFFSEEKAAPARRDQKTFKEEPSFLKKRSKRLLFLCANLTVRFRSEACFQVVSLMSRGE
jgi:hypothetical protein